MTAPFFEFGLFSSEISLLFALLIGISFGFFLEKGGLGNSQKLAGQFYFTDLTVFKVMFSAIITAMLGLFFLSRIGFLDLSVIDLTDTYILPYIAAGLLFGAGFVIGGLCPGTSCVSAATGRLDGIVLMIGMFLGIFLFGETYENFNPFLFLDQLYKVTIPSFLKTSFGLIVFLIVIIALAGFVTAEKIEQRFSKTNRNKIDEPSAKPRINLVLGMIAFVFAVTALIIGDPYKNSYNLDDGLGISAKDLNLRSISSEELAQMIIAKKKDFSLIDLRESEDFKKYHIPSAINYQLSFSLDEFSATGKKIILYSRGNFIDKFVFNNLKKQLNENIIFLEGGIGSWFNNILFPNLNIPRGLSPEEIKKAMQRSRFFGGNPKIKKIDNSKGEKYSREGC